MVENHIDKTKATAAAAAAGGGGGGAEAGEGIAAAAAAIAFLCRDMSGSYQPDPQVLKRQLGQV